MSDVKPRPGDRVRIEYEGTVADVGPVAEGGWHMRVVRDDGGWISADHDAKVTVVKPKVDLVPGQVWRRTSDGELFSALADGGDQVHVYSVSDPDVTVPAVEFYPVDFELLFDPRWKRSAPPDRDYAVFKVTLD